MSSPFKQVLGFAPVLFVMGLMTWAYYSYLYCVIRPMIHPIINQSPRVHLAAIYFLTFTFLFSMMIISYLKAVLGDPGGVPDSWILTGDEDKIEHSEKASLTHDTVEIKFKGGGTRICGPAKCNKRKPDRSHHCSTCKRCILKMDHHCPWIGNCVGFFTHKYFMLFLFYICATCLFFLFTAFEPFLHSFSISDVKEEGSILADINMVFAYFVVLMFAVSLLFFTAFHVRMVLLNTTTIEFLEKRATSKKRFLEEFTKSEITANSKVKLFLRGLPVATGVVTNTEGKLHNQDYGHNTHIVLIQSVAGSFMEHSLPFATKKASTFKQALGRQIPWKVDSMTVYDVWVNPYNLGYFDNFKSVFGTKWYTWLIPTYYGVEGDGIHFPTVKNRDIFVHSRNPAFNRSQDNLAGYQDTPETDSPSEMFPESLTDQIPHVILDVEALAGEEAKVNENDNSRLLSADEVTFHQDTESVFEGFEAAFMPPEPEPEASRASPPSIVSSSPKLPPSEEQPTENTSEIPTADADDVASFFSNEADVFLQSAPSLTVEMPPQPPTEIPIVVESPPSEHDEEPEQEGVL